MPIYDREEKAAILFGAIGLVPYLAVAWGVAVWANGGWGTFCLAIGALVAARAFFAACEGLSALLHWRFRGRKIAVDGFLRSLRGNNFPPRYYQHDDFLTYLFRVRDDFATPPQTKWEAKAIESMLAMFENAGILTGARWHAASEAALEAFSPRGQAPEFRVEAEVEQ